LARDLRGGEQVAIVETADRPLPLAHRVIVEAEAVELERALDAVEGAHALEVGLRRAPAALPVRRLGDADLLGREDAVVVVLCGKGAQQLLGRVLLAERTQRPRAPVAPRWLALLLRRERLDGGERLLPVAGTQRRARAPCDLRVVERRVLRARVPVERGWVVRERSLPRDLAPRERHRIDGQARRPRREALGRLV